MRDIASRVYRTVHRVYDLLAPGLFVVMVASLFIGHRFTHDLFRYVMEPLGGFIIVRWAGRHAWRLYQSGTGLRSFLPRKAPWAP